MGANAAPIPLESLGGGRVTSGARLTGMGGRHRPPGPLRLAFLGRTSTEDQQDPTLSIPRQLNSCRGVLPSQAAIVVHFYDIESGRKDLAARGRGRGHERFAIPVPREGGIQDLLAEAARPDRRFDAVICESIERIARRTYIGTQIENQLEELGVPLLASDEPITLDGSRRATQVLTRRVKQGVAEWYVLELLEKSWGGFEVHTEQGFNVGKPPYGYVAMKLPHPVAARRAEGASKHKLAPDPICGPVVTHIFALRIGERLGYTALASRLNLDLDRFPPPTPVSLTRAVGRWTGSSVREIIKNPKYTGYMVWNRRATKSASGRVNPPQAWVWSAAPTHEPLVTKEDFVAAQQVSERRERSRSTGDTNTAHPFTKRSYRLRSHVVCDECGRRARGKSLRGTVYYVCEPPRGYVPPGHPKSYWVREDQLITGIGDFFTNHIFSPNRRAYVGSVLSSADERAALEHQERIEATRRAIEDLDRRRLRLVRNLELTDDPEEALMRDIRARSAELNGELTTKRTELLELERTQPPEARPELLDLLPEGPIDFATVPERLQEALFKAFNLELRCNRTTNRVRCRITIAGPVIPIQQQAVEAALDSANTRVPAEGRKAPHLSATYPLGGTTRISAFSLGCCRRGLLGECGPVRRSCLW